MREYYVYILECSDGKYYGGVTNDLDRRIYEHHQGIHSSCYTFNRRPVRLVYAVPFEDVSEAIFWEKHIKRWSKKKKQALIQGDENVLHELSACRNETYSNFYRTKMSW